MKSNADAVSFFRDKHYQIKIRLSREAKKRKEDPKLLLFDLFYLLSGFLFSRTHLLFGAYPLGIALLSSVSFGVYLSLLGCIVGAFSMGKSGVVYALIDAITVLLRLFLSANDKKSDAEEKSTSRFRESPMLRCSFAVISGFIAGGYQVLLYGFSLPTVLYAAAMMLFSGGFAFVFSFLFSGDFPSSFWGGGSIAIPLHKNGIGITLGLYVYLFSVSYSLLPVSALGISLSYVFAGFVTLYFAARFGGVWATATGFLTGIVGGTSGAVAFALAGAASGFLFSFGFLYALLGGGTLLVLWSGYDEGLTGFLSVFPEYALAATLGFPLWRKLAGVAKHEEASSDKTAEDMVGAMALSYQVKRKSAKDTVAKAFRRIVPLLRKWDASTSAPDKEAYKTAVCEILLHACYQCPKRDLCGTAGIQNLVRGLTEKSISAGRLSLSDLSFCDKDDEEKEELLYYLSLRLSDLAANYQKEEKGDCPSDVCSIISRLLEEEKEKEDGELSPIDGLSLSLTKVMDENGLPGSVVRVYGERTKTVFAATTDASGRKITSPMLLKCMEEILSAPLGAPSFFRQNATVLLTCQTKKKYQIETALATHNKCGNEPSGDSVSCFESEDGYYYLVLSDGMGTGAQAKNVSAFVSSFLHEMFGCGCTESSSLFLLNSLIRSRKEECSSTVDICEFDLFSGQSAFYKSGAAPSFLKRKDKVYRVRSETVPIGILPTPDTEKIHVETKEGDLIIMFSDGISTSPEDAPWLSGFLSGEVPPSLSRYAESILEEAKKHTTKEDDMTVLVAKIIAA